MVKRKEYLIHFAKPLRRKQTPWENKLWYYLRAGRFGGLKFKRQVPIGEYIVDFCCNEKKIIIELDGSQHQFSENDKLRNKYFVGMGYRVLRFWNNDIDGNLEGVLQKMKEKIDEIQ